MIYMGIIAVDFDGTLCEHKFPEIGQPKQNVIDWVNKKHRERWIIILNTCRDGEYLEKAKAWCIKNDILIDHYNENIPEIQKQNFGKSKVVADIYLDDKALNVKDINSKE